MRHEKRVWLGKSPLPVMWTAVAVLASACGGDGPEAEPDAPPPEPDAPPMMVSPVTGMAIDTYATAQADTHVARDLSAETIAALVLSADGSFRTFPGSGTSQGTFSIPGVPEGPYYLNHGNRFIVTPARTLDLGVRNVGRSTQRTITDPTPLTLAVTDMPAWQDGDFLELYVPNAGAAYSSVDAFSAVPPAVGATTLDLTADYVDAESPNAIDPALGDEAFLIHNTSRTSTEGVPYQGLAAISYLQPFSLAGGTAVTASGAFQAVAQDKTRNIDWRTTEFAGLLNAAVPGGTTQYTNTFVAYVEVDVDARYSLPVVFNLTAPSLPDVLATVSYGNPFPPAWKEYVRASFFGFQQFTSGGKNGFVFAGASVAGTTDQVLAGPIRPAIGAVRNLRVAGRDAAGPLTGLPARPKITWDPPAMGTANSYFVQVLRFVPDATRLNRQTVGRISTTETTVSLPDGILKAGEPHFILVRAMSHPTVPFDRFSFVTAYPFASADRVTTVFTP